jgi:hypothetical protein
LLSEGQAMQVILLHFFVAYAVNNDCMWSIWI